MLVHNINQIEELAKNGDFDIKLIATEEYLLQELKNSGFSSVKEFRLENQEKLLEDLLSSFEKKITDGTLKSHDFFWYMNIWRKHYYIKMGILNQKSLPKKAHQKK